MTTLSTKGQIVIPRKIRSELSLMAGSELGVELLDKRAILLIPRSKNPMGALRGLTKEALGGKGDDAVRLVRRKRDRDKEKDRGDEASHHHLAYR